MAQKVSWLDYMVLGAWAERTAINRNAEDLAEVEGSVSSLKAAVLRQGRRSCGYNTASSSVHVQRS